MALSLARYSAEEAKSGCMCVCIYAHRRYGPGVMKPSPMVQDSTSWRTCITKPIQQHQTEQFSLRLGLRGAHNANNARAQQRLGVPQPSTPRGSSAQTPPTTHHPPPTTHHHAGATAAVIQSRRAACATGDARGVGWRREEGLHQDSK